MDGCRWDGRMEVRRSVNGPVVTLFVIAHQAKINEGENRDGNRQEENRLDQETSKYPAAKQENPHEPGISPHAQKSFHAFT